MEILNFSPEQFKVFSLILIRISVVLYMFPVFQSKMIPILVKAGLALVLTMALFPVVRVNPEMFPGNMVHLLILMVAELFVGMVLGLTVRMFFGAVQLAGELVAFQMGFSFISVLDPQSDAQVSIIDQIGSMTVLVIFLLLNGHHAMISALVKSFQIVDIGMISLKKGFLVQVLSLSTDMFVLGIKMGAPAVGALLCTSAAFGICARFVPQMNVFIAAFPVKIAVGLFFFGITLKILGILTRTYLGRFQVLLTSLLTWMGSG